MMYCKTALMAAISVIALNSQTLAIQRVAARFDYLELRFGYAIPQGENNGLPGTDFIFDSTEIVSFDAERVFDDGSPPD